MEIDKTQKYQKQLGRGSFGQVFLGEDTKNNMIVAIKVIPLEKLKKSPEKIMPSIKNEIKNMQMLKHKNTVNFYNVFLFFTLTHNSHQSQQFINLEKKWKTILIIIHYKGFKQKNMIIKQLKYYLFQQFRTERNLYIIVEYCNQGNLDQLIKQKNLSEEKQGFKCLNQNNIVHRDLKPENILIHDKTIKIADFGFSKVVESGMDEPILYSFVGTPLYMSPQILQKQNYSSKTDIWSLGMIFYELIYSKRAWDGKSYFDLLENILKKPLQFPSQPKVHQQTKNIIIRMLQLKEEERINWEELFQFFSLENLRLIYSDFLGNVKNKQSKEQQNLQLHQLYDQNSTTTSGNPSSPTSAVSMKSERIEEEERNGNFQLNSEGNSNKMDEEILNVNNLQQLNQRQLKQDEKLINESQIIDNIISNINQAQQMQMVIQLWQLLNKKGIQKFSIDEVKQMVMNQIKSQHQNGSQQINQQQQPSMRGGLFTPNNLLSSKQQNPQKNQVNLQQQETNEMDDSSSSQNNHNGNGNNHINGNTYMNGDTHINGNTHMNGNNHMNGNTHINGNNNLNEINKNQELYLNGYNNNINQQSNVDEID